jgi:hypothetical protein
MASKKVVFGRNSTVPLSQVELTLPEKKGILHVYKGPGGRPKLPPQFNLPEGYKTLRYGISKYTDETANKFIDAYYNRGGSATRACRDVGVKYSSFLSWKETVPQFAAALNEVDEIIKDEIHSQFMERVLTTWEPNPTWKLTYFKKHFPQYTEAKKSAKFVFNITDTLIKPDIIEAEVIPPKQLESSNESGPQQTLDTSSNTGKVP